MGTGIDYPRWEEEHKSILETFSNKNLLMLFSGGTESSLTMDFFLRAKREFGFDFINVQLNANCSVVTQFEDKTLAAKLKYPDGVLIHARC